jgi:hypothetical protein
MKTQNIHNNSLKPRKAKEKGVLVASLTTGAISMNQKQKCMYKKNCPLKRNDHNSCSLSFIWYITTVIFGTNLVGKRGDLPKKGGRGNENSKHTQ